MSQQIKDGFVLDTTQILAICFFCSILTVFFQTVFSQYIQPRPHHHHPPHTHTASTQISGNTTQSSKSNNRRNLTKAPTNNSNNQSTLLSQTNNYKNTNNTNDTGISADVVHENKRITEKQLLFCTDPIPPCPDAIPIKIGIPSSTINNNNNNNTHYTATRSETFKRINELITAKSANDYQTIFHLNNNNNICDAYGTGSSEDPDLDDDDYKLTSPKASGSGSGTDKLRIIIVSFRLPIKCVKQDDSSWEITFENEMNFLSSLRILQHDKYNNNYEIVFVGWPGIFCQSIEDENNLESALSRLPKYQCYPIFLTRKEKELSYDIYCKSILWPLFHYQLNTNSNIDIGSQYNQAYKSYCSMNYKYAQKACRSTEGNIDNNYIWFHDYHLLTSAQYVRKDYSNAKIGLFLHTTFPTSEVFRCLPSRLEILRGILSSDIIGFHTYDYCRHFLSSCKRILNLDYYTLPIDATLAIHYYGRDIILRISHIGCRSNVISSKINTNYYNTVLVNTILRKKYYDLYKLYLNESKKLIICCGSNDIIAGTLCNIRAYNKFLENSSKEWRNEVCLIQILSQSTGVSCEKEIKSEIDKIRDKYGSKCIYLLSDYYDSLSYDEIIALYTISDIGLFGTFWDGFNIKPYEFTASQSCRDIPAALILSEFIGSHNSLSGCFRINPFDYDGVCAAIRKALLMTSSERRIAHNRRYKHVIQYTFYKWSNDFIIDLITATRNNNNRSAVSFGFGSNIRMFYVPNNLIKLRANSKSFLKLCDSFKKCAKKRILLFDYGGTLIDKNEYDNNNTSNGTSYFYNNNDSNFQQILYYLNILSSYSSVYVCIVSGATRTELSLAFRNCNPNILICSEKGAFWKWPGDPITEWSKNESFNYNTSYHDINKWKNIAYNVLKIYCNKCDGSYIQQKSTALVWHYSNTDIEYGDMQCVELERYLKRLLDWYYNVSFQRYDHARFLEILPKGLHKGFATTTILDNIININDKCNTNDLFILSIGNDRSDEKMFEAIELSSNDLNCKNNIYNISIGLKTSTAKFYLSKQNDIIWLLQSLSNALPTVHSVQQSSSSSSATIKLN